MTPEEWGRCGDPQKMLESLRGGAVAIRGVWLLIVVGPAC
jgi:hypothetical protein